MNCRLLVTIFCLFVFSNEISPIFFSETQATVTIKLYPSRLLSWRRRTNKHRQFPENIVISKKIKIALDFSRLFGNNNRVSRLELYSDQRNFSSTFPCFHVCHCLEGSACQDTPFVKWSKKTTVKVLGFSGLSEFPFGFQVGESLPKSFQVGESFFRVLFHKSESTDRIRRVQSQFATDSIVILQAIMIYIFLWRFPGSFRVFFKRTGVTNKQKVMSEVVRQATRLYCAPNIFESYEVWNLRLQNRSGTALFHFGEDSRGVHGTSRIWWWIRASVSQIPKLTRLT